ncbi:hypothetical protein DVT68_13925 [Dyella solisilvae]|uniref:DUF4013 domain-containing protein n=1 Tax=Dyella solisilvae TaxID=1920168 RepID=A0A370K690_9GAMM|nr:hypothetical protein [Dyella solisilvae]RDI98171.1 hypothetical protein DVT68_13925 [Dyella solisilvae]
MPRIATVSPDTPFAERFVAGLGYPVRGAGLASCVVLALLHCLAILPAFMGIFASFALWAATWRYAATCLLHTANGYADPPDVGVEENPAAGNGLMAIHLFAMALCLLSALFYPPALWPLMVLFAVMLPAIDMSLAFDGNLELAMSPVTWWDVIGRFGAAYLIPVGLNLLTGALIVAASVATAYLPRVFALPLFGFAYTYLIILNLHLMGAMIHQRHESFGLEPEAEELVRESGQDADTQLLDQVQAVAATDRRAAIALLVARMQDRSAPASLHQAYRDLLRQEGLRDGLLEHGQIWIAALMANGESRRALGLAQDCLELDAGFVPDDPGNAAALAEQAARAGMSRLALKLCRGFLTRWPRSPEAPRVGLLAARLLSQELGQRTEAGVLLGRLAAAWPQHPLHEEMVTLAQQLQQRPDPA